MARDNKSICFLSATRGSGSQQHPGGGEISARELLPCIHGLGYAVEIVAPCGSPLALDPNLRTIAAVRPLRIDARIRDGAAFLCAGLSLARFIISSRNRFSVYYGNGYISMKWLVISKLFGRHPVICHLRESDWSCYGTRHAIRMARHVDCFIAISGAVKNAFLLGTGIEPSRVNVVHNGTVVNTRLLDRRELRGQLSELRGIPGTTPLVLMAARTDPLKGHCVFINAIPEVLKVVGDAMFVIAGLQNTSPPEQPSYDAVMKAIQETGVSNHVLTLPFTENVRDLMRAADVVVVPSTAEGFGRTAIEAMAEQTAVVASDAGGLAEIIHDGTDGMLFPSGNGSALAERLIALLTNVNLRERIAVSGRQTAERKYSIQTTAREIDTVIAHLISEAASSSSAPPP